MSQKRKASLQKKILKTNAFLILIPMLGVAILSIIQLNSLGVNIGTQGAISLEQERTQVLVNKTVDMNDYVFTFFHQVEIDVDRLSNYESRIFNGSISTLDNRPSYRQAAVITPPGLTLSSLYGASISYEYSDFINITVMDTEQELFLKRSAYMDYISAEILQNNPNYASIIMVFENGLSRIYPYIQNGRLSTEDLRESDWYNETLAITTNQKYFADPIEGLISPSIYILRQVYNNSELIGIVGIEVRLIDLQTTFQNIPIYSTGYFSLMNEDKIALIHPGLSSSNIGDNIEVLETSSMEFKEILNSILGGSTNSDSFTKNEIKWSIVYAPVGVGSLYCLGFVPYQEIISPGEVLQSRIARLMTPSILWSIFILIVIIVGVGFSAIMISKRITKPIVELTSSVEYISQGDLTKEIAIDKRNRGNEIGLMAMSFQNLLVTMRLGNKSYYKGDLIVALNNYQAALQLFDTVGNKKGLAMCLNNLGNIYRNWGDYNKAMEVFEQSILIGIELQDSVGLASRYNNRGLLYLTMQQWDAAEKDFMKALEIDTSLDDEKRIAIRKRNLGILSFLKNNEQLARENLNYALQIDLKYDNAAGLAEDYFQLGRFDIMTKNLESAELNFKETLKIAESLENYPLMQNIFTEMVHLYELLENKPLFHKAQTELAKLKDVLVRKKNVIFVIDLSGSMKEHGKIKSARKGALELYEVAINNKDHVAVIGFHSNIELLLPLTEKGPNNDVIHDTISRIEASPYQTRFYDAVAVGIDILRTTSEDEQRWLVALTDGFDNSSTVYNPPKLTKYMRSLEKPLNLILIGVGPELRQVADQFMEFIKTSPRGKYIPIYAVNNVTNQIEQAFKQVQSIMASAEIEGFDPEEA